MDDDDRRTFVQLLDDLDDLHDKADADAVMQRPGIDDRTRALLALAMVAARCEDDKVPAQVRRCVAQGLGRSEVGEACPVSPRRARPSTRWKRPASCRLRLCL